LPPPRKPRIVTKMSQINHMAMMADTGTRRITRTLKVGFVSMSNKAGIQARLDTKSPARSPGYLCRVSRECQGIQEKVARAAYSGCGDYIGLVWC
jgi:hypothetical protein